MMEGTRQRRIGSTPSDLENQEGDKVKAQEGKPVSTIILQIALGIFVVLLLYLILAPSPIDPQPILHEYKLPYFDGVLAPNTKLQEAAKLLEGKIAGPESITADRNGNIYTGLADGRIVKITKSGHLREIARTGHNLPTCGTYKSEPDCGRPLGIRFDRDEVNLIVCDAYYGLLQVNPDTGEIKTLVSAKVGMDGHPFGFTNDLVVSSENVVYFTDSSWKWNRRDNRYAVIEGTGQGRLMSYNLKTGEKATLMSGLYFANGIELSPDEDFVVVCETSAARIIRYFIKGEKTGIYDLFVENLPGLPDNIRRRKEGGYWLGLAGIRKWPFSLLDFLGPYPTIRKIITKVISQESIIKMVPKYGLLLRLDENGDVLESFHDPSGTVINGVSEVHEDEDEKALYLGSYHANFIAKLRL